MDFSNCPRCGKLFQRFASPICDSCIKSEDEDFLRIKEYINDNPGSSMAIVADGTGVSLKRILKYLKEGRLELAEGSVGELACERCDVPITTGKYCKKCQAALSAEMNELLRKDSPEAKKPAPSSSGIKMHYRKENK